MKQYLLLFIFLLGFTSVIQSQNKPQEPQPPFDYIVEEVSFRNEIDDIKLAGTLTYPKTGSAFPAVILISGSGPQDRNSELLGHKPFLVMADYFTTKGIAVLRVDDRGTGETEGNYNKTRLNGFVRDTKAALDFLRKHEKINDSNIGLLGHSLGGTIAPIIACNDRYISYIIMLAGPTMRGDKLMLRQKELIETKVGASKEQVAQGQANIKGAYEIILDKEVAPDELQSQLKAYFKDTFGEMLPDSQIDTFTKQLTIPWLTDFIRHDPAPFLEQVNCPVFALYAEKDLQVPPKENLEVIETKLKSHNTNVVTKIMPGMNHLFQSCETGLPQEYATIEETFSPEVLGLISNWILEQTN